MAAVDFYALSAAPLTGALVAHNLHNHWHDDTLTQTTPGGYDDGRTN